MIVYISQDVLNCPGNYFWLIFEKSIFRVVVVGYKSYVAGDYQMNFKFDHFFKGFYCKKLQHFDRISIIDVVRIISIFFHET